MDEKVEKSKEDLKKEIEELKKENEILWKNLTKSVKKRLTTQLKKV